MIESILNYLLLSIKTNIFIILILLILFILYNLLFNRKQNNGISLILEAYTRNYKRVYTETRIFIFIDNQKYYLKNAEDINKLNKILNSKNIIIDNDKKEFYFIEK